MVSVGRQECGGWECHELEAGEKLSTGCGEVWCRVYWPGKVVVSLCGLQRQCVGCESWRARVESGVGRGGVWGATRLQSKLKSSIQSKKNLNPNLAGFGLKLFMFGLKFFRFGLKLFWFGFELFWFGSKLYEVWIDAVTSALLCTRPWRAGAICLSHHPPSTIKNYWWYSHVSLNAPDMRLCWFGWKL